VRARDWCCILWLWVLGITASAPARAQDTIEVQKLEMRVVSSRAGSATVDHGRDDGLRVGDRVTFRSRDGAAIYGTVSRVDERAGVVDLDEQNLVLPAGTKAEASIPKSRLVPSEPVAPAPEQQQNPPPTAPEHPPWPPRDDAWTQGQALLARVKPLRPNERPVDFRGRVYSIGDYTRSTEDERTDAFLRVGTDLTLENWLGHGDTLNFDGEVNYRNTDVPDNDDESAVHLRLDRASYSVGGNRFAPNRFEAGRFLHDNMPELGVVDGAEYAHRLSNGDRFGFSAGFLPEPDPNMDTFDDFEVSASYRWVYDDSEQLSAALGLQQTLHDWNTDRDLMIAQFQYLPLTGFTFTTTAWIDYYTSGDAAKGQGVELTQAYADTGRNWSDGSSLHLTYSHIAFPEIDRDEFRFVTAQQLADDHNDRVSLQSRLRVARTTRVHGVVGAWADQDEAGGDGELGFQIDQVIFDNLSFDLTGFGVQGKFVDVLGGRIELDRTFDGGAEMLVYELTNNRFEGFTNDNDDLPTHRVRAAADFYMPSGWTISGHVDAQAWDNETSVTIGFYVQRSF
jgi:hypothetical protein